MSTDRAHAWDTARRDRPARLERARAVAPERWVDPQRTTALLEAILQPGDRVCVEGDNQKQADFLARALARVDPARVHDLHLLASVLALPEHMALFERGIARIPGTPRAGRACCRGRGSSGR